LIVLTASASSAFPEIGGAFAFRNLFERLPSFLLVLNQKGNLGGFLPHPHRICEYICTPRRNVIPTFLIGDECERGFGHFDVAFFCRVLCEHHGGDFSKKWQATFTTVLQSHFE
jgi:hypothetical protein